MTAPEYHAGMKRHFGIRQAGKFLDTLLLQVRLDPKIDVLAFDDWLHVKHGNYEDDGMSMRDIITKHYSPAAAAFIESLI